jgi:hypothetical protein
MGAPGIGEPFDGLTASKLAGYTRMGAQEKIVRVYIQVQKVYVLYLFLGILRIFLWGGRDCKEFDSKVA